MAWIRSNMIWRPIFVWEIHADLGNRIREDVIICFIMLYTYIYIYIVVFLQGNPEKKNS